MMSTVYLPIDVENTNVRCGSVTRVKGGFEVILFYDLLRCGPGCTRMGFDDNLILVGTNPPPLPTCRPSNIYTEAVPSRRRPHKSLSVRVSFRAALEHGGREERRGGAEGKEDEEDAADDADDAFGEVFGDEGAAKDRHPRRNAVPRRATEEYSKRIGGRTA
jgi:hypothetical protein